MRRSTLLPVDEILERVRDVATQRRLATPAAGQSRRAPPARCGSAMRPTISPIPISASRRASYLMNVTLLAKTNRRRARRNEHVVVAKKNDTRRLDPA